jgi:hypothetical protein
MYHHHHADRQRKCQLSSIISESYSEDLISNRQWMMNCIIGGASQIFSFTIQLIPVYSSNRMHQLLTITTGPFVREREWSMSILLWALQRSIWTGFVDLINREKLKNKEFDYSRSIWSKFSKEIITMRKQYWTHWESQFSYIHELKIEGYILISIQCYLNEIEF